VLALDFRSAVTSSMAHPGTRNFSSASLAFPRLPSSLDATLRIFTCIVESSVICGHGLHICRAHHLLLALLPIDFVTKKLT
jgi:hypothetical protein